MRFFKNENYNTKTDCTNISFITSEGASLELTEGNGANFVEVDELEFDIECSENDKLWRSGGFCYYGKM